MKKISHIFSFLLLLVIVQGCGNLDVENLNAPDAQRAIATSADLKSIVSGGFFSMWEGTNGTNGSFSSIFTAAPHLAGLADEMTSTNAFTRFWDFTNEPRLKIDNSLTYSGLQVLQTAWQLENAAVSSANDVIKAIKVDGIKVTAADGTDETQGVLASALMLRGMAKGYLANLYNQGFIVNEDTNLENLQLKTYTEILTSAVTDLKEVITLANANTFTTPSLFNTVTLSNGDLGRLAHSYVARFIVQNSRTMAENEAVDWASVLMHVNAGITADFAVPVDGNNWFHNYQYLSGLHWYFRADMRILNMLDSNYPKKYPADQAGSPLAPATSADARLASDFTYAPDMSFFRISRGPTLQSTYYHSRYADQWNNNGAGNAPIMLKAEMDLLKAEAEFRTSNKAGAIATLNGGTRTSRGKLPALAATATDADFWNALYYERDIELMRTGFGISFYDMRRRSALQQGTPLHFPIPADELTTIKEAIYTFGGNETNGTADGANAWDK